ncbi:hypothetical protein NPIL_304521 [Nephila pilipes]|uniref:Uncharacterized protein n=1 Tax=Nephila pilipes TaxID=299642 RepID=A0A8X6Q4Z2_NEPPI|nr:hypothetical protein NPIL_304521 [Nephila pilipes]
MVAYSSRREAYCLRGFAPTDNRANFPEFGTWLVCKMTSDRLDIARRPPTPWTIDMVNIEVFSPDATSKTSVPKELH